MIWRLTYCNKEGVEARLDIIKGDTSTVEVIEGTSAPFLLSYKMDKSDKSGFFMTSSADISIFESGTFNIDNLKTSSETEIKVEHYINSVLDWSGFVIPDFFSKTLGTPSTVEMVASDRLGTLKSVTLSELNQYVSMRDLVEACLAKTGLTLPLYTMADFVNNSQTNAFFKALGLAGRLSDTKGRNISCYDVLKSILVASNSKLVQQSGAWYIVNKFQHEQGVGSLFSTLTASTAYSEQTVNFSDVQIGARRTIIPVGATTGVFQEFGGGRSYPDNFDFQQGLTDWTVNGGFNVSINNREILGYFLTYNINYGDPTSLNYLVNNDEFSETKFLESKGALIPYSTGEVEVSVNFNMVGPKAQFNQPIAKVAVLAKKDSAPILWLDGSGIFKTGTFIHERQFSGSPLEAVIPITMDFTLKGIITIPDGYSVYIRIYGTNPAGLTRVTTVNFTEMTFAQKAGASGESKGNIFRRNQGTGYTKEHEVDTSIFGDYLEKGLDGYFYPYRIDDTSSLYSSVGTLIEPLWTAHGDSEELSLLRHVTRQKSRMFSLAHNMISARIDAATFKPLSIFVDCNSVNPRHVVVSASYDFLRSEVEVELEQIAYATLDVREYIYSYFGDGEQGISSVGGISGGGGGGGSTAPSYWQLDENGRLFTVYDAYSLKELSAYGFGSSGGGGGGLIETVYGYANIGGTFSNTDLNNTFNAYTINQLHLRVATLEAGGSVEWADILNKPSWIGATKPSYSWSEISGKPLTFPPSAHTHPFTEITGTATTAQIPNLAISKITGLQAALDLKLNKSIFDDFFEWDSTNNAIKAKHTFYSVGEVSAYGYGGSGGGGGGGSLVTWSNETTEKVTLTVEGIAKDLSKLGHTHAIANITGLQTQLNAKALNTININAGTGLTGGGNLTANRTISLSATTIGQIAEGVQAKQDIDGLEIGGRNYFSINDFVADNKARGYSTIEVIQHEGNIAYRSSNITNNHNIPRYLQGKFEANIQYYLQFKINWESYTDSGAFYIFRIRYTDGTTSELAASTSQTSRSMLTTSGKTIDYITTTRQYDGTVVIYEVQIEKSNKARDWTPAPEDQVSDWDTTDVTSFSYIKNKPTTLAGYGITDAVTLNTAQIITGAKTFTSNVGIGTTAPSQRFHIEASSAKFLLTDSNVIDVNNNSFLIGATQSNPARWAISLTNRSGGSITSYITLLNSNVGIGTDNPLYKLDVSGTGRFTGDLTAPKVIFSAAGWAMVQTGTELQMQYNGVAKMRFLNGGSIVAVQEITAYS